MCSSCSSTFFSRLSEKEVKSALQQIDSFLGNSWFLGVAHFVAFLRFHEFPFVSFGFMQALSSLSTSLCTSHGLNLAISRPFTDRDTDMVHGVMESWSMRDETELFAHYAHFAPPKFHPDRFRRWK